MDKEEKELKVIKTVTICGDGSCGCGCGGPMETPADTAEEKSGQVSKPSDGERVRDH
jgi:hypothetical protein